MFTTDDLSFLRGYLSQHLKMGIPVENERIVRILIRIIEELVK